MVAEAAPLTNAGQAPSVFVDLARSIVKRQEQIIGPLAVEQANSVPHFHIDPSSMEVEMTGNPQSILESLVEQYRDFFGRAAVEVCKEVVAQFASKISPDQLPKSLQ